MIRFFKKIVTKPKPINRKIDKIIIHHSATPAKMDIGVEEIRKWHLERGFNDIGYHDVIRLNGRAEEGRPLELAGAHCKGHNANSIGICVVGTGPNFTQAQWKTLRRLVSLYKAQYPKAAVYGHKDLAPTLCPGFEVYPWLKNGMIYNGET